MDLIKEASKLNIEISEKANENFFWQVSVEKEKTVSV